MNAMKNIITLIVLFAFTLVGAATGQQEGVDFSASVSRNKVGLNQRIKVDFVIKNSDGDNFKAPDFKGFNAQGPMHFVQQEWINGKMNFSRTYTYYLQPTARGKFTIGQATIEVEGHLYKTSPIEIEVTAAVDNPNADPTLDDTIANNLHLVAEVSKNSPYVNEAMTVVYKLYVGPSLRVDNFDFMDDPKYNNFWSQEIRIDGYNVENVIYQGKSYRMVVLKKVVLYPQQSGKLEIEPLSLNVSMSVPTSKRDFLGRTIYEKSSKVVSAGTRTINVKALPEEGKPENFSGAVGKFSFGVTTTKNTLKASESLQAEIKVSGNGNLRLFSLPKLVTPSALETYNPEYNEKVSVNLSGMEGNVSETYTIVSKYKGKYPLPQVSFSYFNPETKKYTTITSDEIEINVTEGPVFTGTDPNTETTGTNQQQVVLSSNDFRFIKINPELVPKEKSHFYKSVLFYVLLLVPFLFIPIAVFARNKREAYVADVAGNKIRRANKLAKKYLSTAKRTLGNKEAFYIALEKALHNYLKAKLHIETSEFSKEKIESLLQERNVDSENIEGFIELLKSCELARYSPASDVTMQHDYDKAANVITKIDKQI